MKEKLEQVGHSRFLEVFTTIMATVGHSALYIQAYKIYCLESAYAVSLIANIIAATSMVCWLLYGTTRHIKPLIISNLFGLVGACCVLGGILYFGWE